VSLVLSAALAAITTFFSHFLPTFVALGQLLNFVLSFGFITLLFAAIYKFLPDVNVAWKDLWIGAATTSLLFNIGKFLIGLYLGNSGATSAYGAAGSLVILLLWVFYSAQIILFGAEFTQVFAKHRGSEITPSDHAVWIIPKAEGSAAMQTESERTQPAQSTATPRKRRNHLAAWAGSAVMLIGAVRQSAQQPRRRKRR
jgi:membrane protein